MHDPPVVVQQLSQRAGRRLVLEDVSFAAGPGIITVVGANGAGKTTLLRALATVTTPTSGSVYLLGHDIGTREGKRYVRPRLGYLPQVLGYYPHFTAVEFVEYIALLKGLPFQDAARAARAALESAGISGKAQAVKLGALSGGTLRRVGIAQALVNNPKILILDEPTAGLDPSQRAAFRELLARHRQHRTVVLSTHLLDDVSALADHVLVLEHGRITFSGRPDALARSPGFPTETIEARNEGWACAGEELHLS